MAILRVRQPDGSWAEVPSIVGSRGPVGADGVSCTHSWDGTTLTVTSASGTSSADLKGDKGDAGNDGYTPVKGVDYFDGVNGKDGSNGKDGTSVSVASVSESAADGGSNVVTFSDGKTLTVKNGKDGTNGQNGSDGKTPVKGTDYWTASDKNEIVTAVKNSLAKENWTFTLEDGSSVTKEVYVG